MSDFFLVNITHVRFLALSTDWMMNILMPCILCCKALVLCLFSIVSAAVLDVDFAAVPYPSSNVPFPVHGFKQVFHF
jgi:hypothetical protein